MAVDVITEIVIERPVAMVSEFAGDPANAPRWYVNIKQVEWKTAPPLQIGSEIAFVAQFLGRRLVYTYRITEFLPGKRLVMATAQGPFPMETIYVWEALGAEKSKMMLRNRGNPAGFATVFAPFMAMAMRSANRKDLVRLKELLESA